MIHGAFLKAGLTSMVSVKFRKGLLKVAAVDHQLQQAAAKGDVGDEEATAPSLRILAGPDPEARRRIQLAMERADPRSPRTISSDRLRSGKAKQQSSQPRARDGRRKSPRLPGPWSSLPCSPSRQLEEAKARRSSRRTAVSPSAEDAERFERYVGQEMPEEDFPQKLPPHRVANIRSKLKKRWFTSLMLKKSVNLLHAEVDREYNLAIRRAVLEYILLDEGSRRRLNIMTAVAEGGPAFPMADDYSPAVVRAPVPWHQSYIVAKQFCRHNLFVTNPLVVRLNRIWINRFRKLRFVNTSLLINQRGDPLNPVDAKDKIFEQCFVSRNTLLKVRIRIAFKPLL